MTDFYPSSVELVNCSGNTVKRGNFNTKYRWKELPLGYSFPVAKNRIKRESLKSLALRWGKKLNRRFIVFDHSGTDVYEVGRVAIVDGEK